MPDHSRKQIRDAVKTKLDEISGLTVETTRSYDIESGSLPAAIIYTSSERSQLLDMTSRDYQRDLSLTIEIYQKGKNIDDLLDAIALSIEKKMEEAYIISDRETTQLVGSLSNIDSEGNSIVGVLTLEYEITYFTRENAPENIH